MEPGKEAGSCLWESTHAALGTTCSSLDSEVPSETDVALDGLGTVEDVMVVEVSLEMVAHLLPQAEGQEAPS